MYYRFGKAFHVLSALFFVVSFLYIYSALPEFVGYEPNEDGVLVDLIAKGTFFYLGLVLFGILNVLMLIPAKLIENQSTTNLRRLFPTGDVFRDYVLTWLYSFAGVINLNLFILALYIHSINNQNEIGTGEFAFFFYLVPILFVIWIIALFWILLQKFKTVKDRD